MKILSLVLCISLLEQSVGVNENIVENEYVPYQVYVENTGYNTEDDKCMTGAYISDENACSSIKKFEEYTGVNCDMYVSIMRAGDDFPLSEITDAWGKGKLPVIILEKGFGISQAETVAKMCGKFNMFMIVEIKTDDIYVYECIGDMFRKYAGKARLAWSVDAEDTQYNMPDESLVDIVAVEIKEIMAGGSIVSEYEDGARQCEYFSGMDIILNVSVPNFSTEGCKYVYNEAACEIGHIYSLACEYGNVTGINYISTVEKRNNMTDVNYRITEDESIVKAFAQGCAKAKNERIWVRTPYIAYVKGPVVILSNRGVRELGLKGKYINSGYSYVNVSGFNKTERKVFVKS